MRTHSLLLFALLGGPLTAHAALVQDNVRTLAVDGRANANPSIAAQGRFVVVVWSAAAVASMDVFAATSRDGGLTFSMPTQVNAVPGEARVSGEQPPRVALVPHKGGGSVPDIVVVWTAKIGTSGTLLAARSTNGGRTFSASTAVPGSDGEGSRGWESVAVDASGRVLVLWLDHRLAASSMPSHVHNMGTETKPPATATATATATAVSKPDPTERADLSQLYFSSLDGATATTITRGVCYCCKTSLVTSGNNVYAAWRHVYPGSVRDIAFAMSTNGGRTFTAPLRVNEDQWQIDGCPENGPSMAVDRAQRLHLVWPSSSDGKDASLLTLYYASSRDGRTFGARLRIPTRGPASHAQLVIGADGAPVVAWDEIVDGTRRLGMARIRVDAAGKTTFTAIASPDNGPGQWYPVLATTSDGLLSAWVRQLEKGSVIGVARVK